MNTSARSAVAPRAVSAGGVAVLGPSAADDMAEVPNDLNSDLESQNDTSSCHMHAQDDDVIKREWK